MPNKCKLCGNEVGKNEYIHSASSKHLSLLKKRMAYYKQMSIAKYGYFKYHPIEQDTEDRKTLKTILE